MLLFYIPNAYLNLHTLIINFWENTFMAVLHLYHKKVFGALKELYAVA